MLRATACCDGLELAVTPPRRAARRRRARRRCARTRRGAGAGRRAAARARAARWTAGAARRARPRRPPPARRRGRARPAARRGAPAARRRRAARRAASAPTSTWSAASRSDKLRIGGAALVVVGADREHDDGAPERVAGRRHEPADELDALALVVAGGEDLLELVDGDQEAPAPVDAVQLAVELALRPLAGADHHGCQSSLPGRMPPCEGGEQAGAQHGGLPAARRRRRSRAAARRPAARPAPPRAARARRSNRASSGAERPPAP